MSERPIKILRNPEGHERISRVLSKFAQPWVDLAQNDEECKRVVALAVVAWNLASLPEAERFEGLDPDLLGTLGQPGLELLQSMIARKLALFSDYNRPILDYQFSGAGEHLRLDVVSAVPNPEKFLGQAEAG